MIRETFGAQLPPIEESHVGDRFYNTAEDKHYVFDDGEWKAIPETPEPDIPTPTVEDVNKVIAVNEEGEYELTDASSSSDLPTPTTEDEGKVLAVDAEGEYALSDPPSGLPDATGVTGGMLITKSDGTYYLSGHVGNNKLKPSIPSELYSGSKAIILSSNTSIANDATYRNEVSVSSVSSTLSLMCGMGLRQNFYQGASAKIYLGNFNKANMSNADYDYIVVGGGSNNNNRADCVKIGGIQAPGGSTVCLGYIALGSTSEGSSAVYTNNTNTEALLVGGSGTSSSYRTTGLYLKNIATLNANGLTINGKTLSLAQLESIMSTPSTAGTYSLQCTVDSGGAATFSWV